MQIRFCLVFRQTVIDKLDNFPGNGYQYLFAPIDIGAWAEDMNDVLSERLIIAKIVFID